MSKTILICQVFHPDEQATSQLLSDLLVELSARGHAYEVLTGFPAKRTAGVRSLTNETWHGVRILRGGLQLDYKRSLVARALGYSSYCFWIIWRLLLRTPSDAQVVVITNPPFAPVLVHWCSQLRGWSYDIVLHDIYPDGLVAVGMLSEGSLVTRLWRRFNRQAFAGAQRVWVLGRDMIQLCKRIYALDPKRIRYAPNWSSVCFLERTTAEATQLWRQLGFHDKFVVQYSGNMGLWHDLDCLVEAAGQLRDKQRIRFLMIGNGMRRAAAERRALSLGLSNMDWLPYQPRQTLRDSLSCAHVSVISQRAGLEGVAVPSKLYGILASGRAVLAQVPATSEVARVIAEEDCGIWIEPGDTAGLVKAIKHLAESPAQVGEMGVRALAAYRAKYTVEKAADLFESLHHGGFISAASGEATTVI